MNTSDGPEPVSSTYKEIPSTVERIRLPFIGIPYTKEVEDLLGEFLVRFENVLPSCFGGSLGIAIPQCLNDRLVLHGGVLQ
jgi:hypothetical protein